MREAASADLHMFNWERLTVSKLCSGGQSTLVAKITQEVGWEVVWDVALIRGGQSIKIAATCEGPLSPLPR